MFQKMHGMNESSIGRYYEVVATVTAQSTLSNKQEANEQQNNDDDNTSILTAITNQQCRLCSSLSLGLSAS